MKLRIKYVALFLSLTLTLCACNNITYDGSSETSNDYNEEGYAIIHEKTVNEGDSLNDLFKDGTIPDFSDFGINYELFEYKESVLDDFIRTNDWEDSGTEKPSNKLYCYSNRKENSERIWNESIYIDEFGRLCEYFSSVSEEYIENIPDEKTLTEDELNKWADEIVKVLCKNGKTNFEDYKKKVRDYSENGIDLYYSNHTANDRVKRTYYVKLLPNGEINHLYAGYCDIHPSYSPDKFDENVDELIKQCVERKTKNSSAKRYEYEIEDKKYASFESFNGKIYGAYGFTITYYYGDGDDEYYNECYEMVFEDTSCSDVSNT